MNAQKERVYVSIPVDMLTREQVKRLQVEVAGLLDPEMQEAIFNEATYDTPEDAPLRLWRHLSASMLLIGECDAVLFAPGWNYYNHCHACWIEFEAAIRSEKRCLYVWRDEGGKLQLLDMPHCGGPETTVEDEQ